MELRLKPKGWFATRSGRETLSFYMFISPWLLGFIILTVGMVMVGLIITTTNYDGLMAIDQIKYVAAKNYDRLATDTKLPLALSNTIYFAILSVPIGILAQLGLALLLNLKSLRGRNVFRTLFYVPSIMPLVAVVLAFQLLFDKNTGLVNAGLNLLSPGISINWRSGDSIKWVLIALSVWVGLGSGMIIFLAGLQGIPVELKEAAMIDGANNRQVLFRITLPLLSPVIFFQLVMGIIFSMQMLMQPLLLSAATSGYGGRSATLTLQPITSIYMWNNHAIYEMFGNGRYGYGMILLWIMFILVGLLSLVVFRTSRYWVFYDNE